MPRFVEADRIAMRKMRESGALLRTIANAFGCSVPHVASIINGRSGAHDGVSVQTKPEWRAPITGSASGFIKPIDYKRLVAGR